MDTVSAMSRGGLLFIGCVALIAACSSGAEGNDSAVDPSTTTEVDDSADPTATTTTDRPTTTTKLPPTTRPASTSSTATSATSSTTSAPPTSTSSTPTTPAPTSSTTTTTTSPPALDVYDPACVVQVVDGDSLTIITERIPDELVVPETVQAENGLVDDVIHPGQLLDVCVGNGVNDITGEQRVEPNDAVASLATRRNVEMQQRKLNELFAGYGIKELLVDGISGPVTRQRLCAFRLALGFPASTEDMAAGSDEEKWLMALTYLPVPQTSATESERWILIDRTCQIMFVGAGPEQIAYVFPTSTGEPGYETRDQNRTRVFRYNPEFANGGWHNSSTFPAAEDNPLNGNMYKPLYFDRGQAIHGALNVPTSPQSKGCARLRVEHQELLVGWLGLGDLQEPTGDSRRINVTVNVQGEFVFR